MLHKHTKFLENGQSVPEKKKKLKDFTIHGCGGHFGHVTQMPRTNFRSTYPRRLHIQSGFDLPSVFREKYVLAL